MRFDIIDDFVVYSCSIQNNHMHGSIYSCYVKYVCNIIYNPGIYDFLINNCIDEATILIEICL